MDPTALTRRRLLRLGGLTATAGLAGCTAPADDGSDDTTDAPPATTATSTAAPTTDDADSQTDDNPPGADVLGGPDDLQASTSVTATTLGSDEGAGRFVFTPAAVWVESGATVTWTVDSGNHSVTAYHADNDRATRVPDGAAAFDSGTMSAGSSFEHTFETDGVYNYFCLPHEGLAMAGVVVVGGPAGGPGSTPPDDVGQEGAAEKLARILSAAGVTS